MAYSSQISKLRPVENTREAVDQFGLGPIKKPSSLRLRCNTTAAEPRIVRLFFIRLILYWYSQPMQPKPSSIFATSLPTLLHTDKLRLARFLTARFYATGFYSLVSLSLAVSSQLSTAAPTSAHHHGLVSNHAPIGVMGDHLHGQGEWMFSYRYMQMRMEDNLSGSAEISPDTIVTTQANRF